MSSLVELKDACIDKALEVVNAIDADVSDADESEVKAKTVCALVSAACQADTQANSDAWAKDQTASSPKKGW